MKAEVIDEPVLQFGATQHADIRYGLINGGPFDASLATAPREIRLGIIGDAASVEGLCTWVNGWRRGVAAKVSDKPNLFVHFPGCGADSPLPADVVIADNLIRTIPARDIQEAITLGSQPKVVERAVELFVREIDGLMAKGHCTVICCAVPAVLLQAMDTLPVLGSDPRNPADFRGMLKAKAMRHPVPLQLILPDTYGGARRSRKSAFAKPRQLQDAATRAWNLYIGLYYKSAGTPWRLCHDPTALDTCFIGVSFYQSLDRTSVQTSVAQIFNERGEGVIVRGGQAVLSKHDRQPHLREADAIDLVHRSLVVYRGEHRRLPARVVIHKTSAFDDGERRGFQKAVANERIDYLDQLHVSGSMVRLFRAGRYPPLRGTMMGLSDERVLLYTKGSVAFFETWPGMYIPSPLDIRISSCESTPKALCTEILALSKMGWNNTQFDRRLPITIAAARDVGDILKYCDPGSAIQPRFAFYI